MCNNVVSSYLICLPCSMLNIFKAENYSIFHKKGRKYAISCKRLLSYFFLTKDFNFEISGVLIFLTSFPMGNQWIP